MKKKALTSEAPKICNVSTRTITLPHHTTNKSALDFCTSMDILESLSEEDIYINLFNYGGNMHAGFAIAGRMSSSPCKTITTCYGAVMSAGIYILVSSDERRSHVLTTFMHHEPSVSFGHMGVEGTKHQQAAVESEYKRICKWIAQRTNQDFKYWYTKGRRDNDFYFDIKEAELNGLIHVIIGEEVDSNV